MLQYLGTINSIDAVVVEIFKLDRRHVDNTDSGCPDYIGHQVKHYRYWSTVILTHVGRAVEPACTYRECYLLHFNLLPPTQPVTQMNTWDSRCDLLHKLTCRHTANIQLKPDRSFFLSVLLPWRALKGWPHSAPLLSMQFSVTCTKGLKSSGVTATAAALPHDCALALSNHLYNNEALG